MNCSTDPKVNQKARNIRKMTSTAMLGAAAAILMFLEIPLPGLMPAFIKFDFSDLPALIAAFTFGPLSGIVVCAVKNLVHLPFSQSMGIGELSNFLMGTAFILPAGLIYKRVKTRTAAILSALGGAMLMAAASVPINLFLIYPMYERFVGFPIPVVVGMYKAILPAASTLLKCLLIFNLPFTFIKGLASVFITLLVYKKLAPVLRGKC
ncbi:MAG: ECF transporter S component [Oscillospiraceae bacterium]